MEEPQKIDFICAEIANERWKQDEKWGIQDHANGSGGVYAAVLSRRYKEECERRAREGTVTWFDILREEVYEVWAESDPEKVRAELIQVAAVCVAQIECIDRRCEAPMHGTLATYDRGCRCDECNERKSYELLRSELL